MKDRETIAKVCRGAVPLNGIARFRRPASCCPDGNRFADRKAISSPKDSSPDAATESARLIVKTGAGRSEPNTRDGKRASIPSDEGIDRYSCPIVAVLLFYPDRHMKLAAKALARREPI